MRKKIFGLEQVLNFRKEVEKVRKTEFAAAKSEFETAHDRLRSEEERMDRVNTEFMDRQLKGIGAVELQMYSDFFSKKSADIKAQRHTVTSLDKNVNEKREILLEAAIDKKVLEELKDKKIRAHKQNLAEKDRAFLDELALRKGGNTGR
ncbi:MAG TPA: flagellar export protein FliJ [Geobacteraceae bacterium]|jgi:flagellar FliJ protein|nr:flagellar export protein FliJ [Geobacteraceae bacterium]